MKKLLLIAIVLIALIPTHITTAQIPPVERRIVVSALPTIIPTPRIENNCDLVERQINDIRLQNKLNELNCNDTNLENETQERANYINKTGDYSHTQFLLRFTNETRGEDLSRGYTNGQVVSAWMNSPTHKEVILDPVYTEVAFARSGQYTVLWFK